MTTTVELVRALRQRRFCPYALHVRFGGRTTSRVIGVNSNSPALIELLTDYFQPFLVSGGVPDMQVTALEAPEPELGLSLTVKTPEPGKSKIKEEYADLQDGRVVRKRLTGMHFVFGSSINVAVGPCLENSNQVVNFINNRFIQEILEQGALLGHAAGIAWKGRGLALAGFSGKGKSTLALKCMQLGASLVSNDRIMILESGHGLDMLGVAKLPRINPGTVLHNDHLRGLLSEQERARFAAMDRESLWAVEHKYDVPLQQCFGPGSFHLEAPMHGLVILNWDQDGKEMDIREVSLQKRQDLLAAFRKDPGLFSLHQTRASARAYIQLLERCKVVEMTGGADFELGARTCLEILDKARAA